VHNLANIDIPQIQKEEPLKLELEDFLQSVSEMKKPAVDGMEGWAILKIALESSSNNFCTLPQTEIRNSYMNREKVFSGHVLPFRSK